MASGTDRCVALIGRVFLGQWSEPGVRCWRAVCSLSTQGEYYGSFWAVGENPKEGP